MGVVSEIIPCFCRKRIFGYAFIGFSSFAIAVFSFLVWGHHLFVSGQSVYGGMVFSLAQLPGGDPLGDQSLQLDRDAAQGLHHFRYSHALCARVRRPVYHGRTDGAVRRGLGLRRSCPRHLFHRGPLPLHHGRWRRDGIPGRNPFLVAQDDRAALPGGLGAILGGPDLRGLQSDFFPAVHSWLPRHAAALPCVSPRVSGSQRDVVGRGFDPGTRLFVPAHVSIWSLYYGKIAGPNPWRAAGLEWQTSSPPPTENFVETPVVVDEAYDYPRIDGLAAAASEPPI